jgi:cellulose synthase/poly-beta-1,6-N-acetylglucosamine synthase-like glycosyltransferase
MTLSPYSNDQKISILIPAHNEEQYIIACLEALMRLDYPADKMEVIVCNNNSTDGTVAVVEAFAANHPTVRLVHETKVGPNAARQKAFSVSTGTFIATIDSDTIASATWAQNAVGHFADPKVVAVSGACRFDTKKKWLSAVLWFEQAYFMRFWHFILHTIFRKWGMMLAGFVMVGGALRRRNQSAVAA